MDISTDIKLGTLRTPPGVASLLSSLIHDRTGLDFEADRADLLLEKLSPLVHARGCSSYLDYYYLLKYEENGMEDWENLMDALSVPETYFWREHAQITAFANTVVRQWFARTTAPLRVWSAACATGEEPFSLMIALAEAGWADHPIEVVASDGSHSALAAARQGVFREKSFRNFPNRLREKYFSPDGEVWRIRRQIADRVQFRMANLLAPAELAGLADAPVIFCRNVFIYFSAHAIRQTLALFASLMPVNGHLFVGAAESLLRLTVDFELRQIDGAFVYVKV